MDRRNYSLVTLAYWGFTLTDGALRMLVLLHFHTLGYSPVQLAFLFLFYEFFGVLTNFLGGWIGSRMGLRITLFAGLATQIGALLMLSGLQESWGVAYSVMYVMAAQAVSGIAKDLTKMSAKSAVKVVVASGEERRLFKWVAVLTGSKNALKGVGFFLGGFLLERWGFVPTLYGMAGMLGAVLLVGLVGIRQDLGKAKVKVKFRHLFAKRREINVLSGARLFLFGARDLWFVVGLPVFLIETMGWRFTAVGGFLAAWVIGYGMVQAVAPAVVRQSGAAGAAKAAVLWSGVLLVVTAAIALCVQIDFCPEAVVLGGLGVFGVVFAINSAVHSYLILAYTDTDQVAVDVGFYYMANATGRLVGTLGSGVAYVVGGLSACLWCAAAFVLLGLAVSLRLPRSTAARRRDVGRGMSRLS